MFCPYCGKKLPDGAKFCGGCGRRIDTASDLPPADKKKIEQAPAKKTASDRPDSKKPDRKSPSGGKPHRWPAAMLFAALLVAAILVGLVFLLPGRSSSSASSGGNTISCKNGDTIYVSSEADLAFDEEASVLYYDNILMVYLYEEPDETLISSLTDAVDGTVAGQISGLINILQITVKSTDLDGINAYAQILMESEEVIYAGYDYPVFIETDDSNPWSDAGTISDKGNEDSPDGNDWWAEAVGAYTAWAIADTLELSSVKTGILDAGFDLDHEDISTEIELLSGYSTNSEEDHGTHVAGIIGADDNSLGIRGIADSAQLICGDLTPDSGTSYMSSGEYAEMIKVMAESGVKVINNSWGAGVVSAVGYAQSLSDNEDTESVNALQLIEVYATGAYESYINYIQTYCKRTAMDCLLLIFQLDCAGYEDLLLVKSAGNGYTDVVEGLETAVYSGFFGSITEDLFNSLTLSSHGYTYSDIRDHILIVGAVKNETDSDGNYLMTDFSNWGGMVDICAPGYEIYSTLTDNDYGTMSGTSMATPMVTGAAALLWQIDPTLTAAEVKDLLLENTLTSASGVQDDSGSAYPMLNIGEAVRAVSDITVTFRILNKYEEFLDEAQVVITDTSGNAYTAELTETNDGDELFFVNLCPGEYEVSVTADGYEDLSEETAVSTGTTLLSYVLEEEVDWAQIYLDYLADAEVQEGFIYEEEYLVNGSSYEGFGLIYVNDDEIPELVLYGLSEATGAVILTVTDDGEADALQTYRLGYSYVEYGNLIDIGGGNNGLDTNTLYEIDENGEWSFIIEGRVDYNTETYTWDGEAVSEAEYEDALSDYYSSDDLADTHIIYYTLENIRRILKEAAAG